MAFIITTLAGLSTLLGMIPIIFKIKNKEKIITFALSFSAGVMLTVSILDLIPESLSYLCNDYSKFCSILLTLIFIVLGILFSNFVDKELDEEKKYNNKLYKLGIISMLAIMMHNIPEGMAVGVAFAGAMIDSPRIALAGALALAAGIGIQNFPEGAIISMPLRSQGTSRPKAFFYGVLSGLVEPVSAVFTILLARMVVPVLPFLLAFAAGAMIYVVVEELIPESQAGDESHRGTFGVAAGFAIMMILDVAWG